MHVLGADQGFSWIEIKTHNSSGNIFGTVIPVIRFLINSWRGMDGCVWYTDLQNICSIILPLIENLTTDFGNSHHHGHSYGHVGDPWHLLQGVCLPICCCRTLHSAFFCQRLQLQGHCLFDYTYSMMIWIVWNWDITRESLRPVSFMWKYFLTYTFFFQMKL